MLAFLQNGCIKRKIDSGSTQWTKKKALQWTIEWTSKHRGSSRLEFTCIVTPSISYVFVSSTCECVSRRPGGGYLQEDTEPVCPQPRAERSGVCFATSPWTWPTSAEPGRTREQRSSNRKFHYPNVNCVRNAWSWARTCPHYRLTHWCITGECWLFDCWSQCQWNIWIMRSIPWLQVCHHH